MSAERVVSFLVACGESEELVLRGVGRLSMRHYQAYDGRNPRTGEPTRVPAKKLAFFRVDPTLLCTLNGDDAADGDEAPEEEAEEGASLVRAPFADALGDAIRARLLAGETAVAIDALGTFSVVEKRGRPGVNPDTGEPITIPPRRIVRFASAESLVSRLNESRKRCSP